MLAGAGDHLYAPGDLEAIGAQLERDGVRHELVIYPDAPHGFACFERDTCRPGAAADTWRRTDRLLAASSAPDTIPLCAKRLRMLTS
jgi:carboxymethylenebutenolidase